MIEQAKQQGKPLTNGVTCFETVMWEMSVLSGCAGSDGMDRTADACAAVSSHSAALHPAS